APSVDVPTPDTPETIITPPPTPAVDMDAGFTLSPDVLDADSYDWNGDEDEEPVEEPVEEQPVEQPIEEPVEEPSSGKTHVVQPGETLYRIAMNYYNSPDAVEKIKSANGLSSNSISTGQTLILP
ncbi:MAG: LysM peptidoglycan-binding domain-containing protein, partial [Paenisporosarcina sp.]|nr:LysM peptidoglycan-binding domain-containing protein [Paenisporosarcina sp.]